MTRSPRARDLAAGILAVGLPSSFGAGPGRRSSRPRPSTSRRTPRRLPRAAFFYAQAHGMFKAAGDNITTQLAPSGSVSMLAVVGARGADRLRQHPHPDECPLQER